MLLTISTTHQPASDLGYLLHKNPARVQTEELSFGKAHVFYPEASEDLCTAALLLEVDPIALVRNNRGPAGEGGQLQQYVNDRPYGANSFLSVAIGRLFASALGGRSKERAALAGTAIPLVARIPAIATHGGGEDLVRRLFEPLGYVVTLQTALLDGVRSRRGERRPMSHWRLRRPSASRICLLTFTSSFLYSTTKNITGLATMKSKSY